MLFLAPLFSIVLGAINRQTYTGPRDSFEIRIQCQTFRFVLRPEGLITILFERAHTYKAYTKKYPPCTNTHSHEPAKIVGDTFTCRIGQKFHELHI